MADESSRAIQAAIDNATSLTSPPTTPQHGNTTHTTNESDTDFEPGSEDTGDAEHLAFLEQLLASEGDGEEGEDEEDDDGMTSCPVYTAPKLTAPRPDEGTEHAFGEIQIEFEEPAVDGTAEDTERSELYLYTFIQTIMLILRFAVLRQRRNIIRLLQNYEVGRLFRLTAGDDLDDDEDDEDIHPRWRRRRRPKPDPNRFPKVPSDEGTELMRSGIFGSNEAQAVTSNDMHNISRKKRLAMRIMDRELAIESPAKQKINNRLMAQVSLIKG